MIVLFDKLKLHAFLLGSPRRKKSISCLIMNQRDYKLGSKLWTKCGNYCQQRVGQENSEPACQNKLLLFRSILERLAKTPTESLRY
ncbi:unnamed protein product [Moneuplotes crassus]|uniref:Uncharacterized protein n=1 Tax=Euplotes crassus TaxID=5936 RepID=A0AAD1XB72_EUPCR|nr:unnamed protein product [Moneuplotes crassus]